MKMDEFWMFNRFKHRSGVLMMMIMCLLFQNLSLCCSLNDEGLALLKLRDRMVDDPLGALSNWNDDDGEIDPCSWFGVECSEGKVVVLNLKNLCLGGTLAPELGNLVHIKSIVLRNNSFSGIIPEEIGELKELEVLDLGYNNFSGSIPSKLGNNLSMTILLLDNNGILGSLSPEVYNLKMISEIQVDKNQLSNALERSSCNKRFVERIIAQSEDAVRRVLLQATSTHDPKNRATDPPSSSSSPSSSPSPSPSSSPTPLPPFDSPSSSPLPNPDIIPPSSNTQGTKSPSKSNNAVIIAAVIGGSVLIFMSVIGIFYFKSKKVTSVKPWATGLSGQLSKAFITGVPNLKRSELETACEDFSNVIGTSSMGTVYKGTLSSGVEIAVASIAVKTSRDWSMNLEAQFWKKIDTLSKVNHKNFVNLIGYCEDEEPFTRMMVFEYAPNGTLFEHLHFKEAEHLDWEMRLRIAVGMAYCLEHMHQLTPHITHRNLTSAAVNLTEDYAAKISDFSFWNEEDAAQKESTGMELLLAGPESNVYSFGVILFEMVTGRLPFSVDSGSLEDWASDYVRGEQPLKEMIDPTLNSFQEDQLEGICEVVKYCVHPDPRQRPLMKEITARLRDITGIGPGAAVPRLSPLWWAELEIMSTEAI